MKPQKILLLFMLLLPMITHAQRYKTVELKPIFKQGFTYYYDSKKVQTPYALQVPIQALNDDEVNRYYRNFNRLKTAGGLVLIVPAVYLLTTTENGLISNPDAFIWMIIGAFGANIICDVFAHAQLKRSIDRYNQLIVVPSSHMPGVSMKYRF
jgi:hypothetical protein